MRIDLHTTPSKDVWCYGIEVSDPHTQELLAKVLDPTKPAYTAAQRAALISTDVRGIFLELTDPDPF